MRLAMSETSRVLALAVGCRYFAIQVPRTFFEHMALGAERNETQTAYSLSRLGGEIDRLDMDLFPLSPEQNTWVRKYAKQCIFQLLRSYRGECYGERSREIATRIQAFYTTPSEYPAATSYRGRRYYDKRDLQTWMERNAALGLLVKQAIRDDDALDLEDFIIDLHDTDTLPAFEKIKNALDGNYINFCVVSCDCGHFERDDETTEVHTGNGRYSTSVWCTSCRDNDAHWCVDTEDYRDDDHSYYHEGPAEYCSYPEEPDEDDDESEEEADSRGIMSYSTNVLNHAPADHSIKSNSYGEFTLGIELEMTSGDSYSGAAAEQVRSRLGETYCIMKSDGSLPENGFEIVTAPRGLAEHTKRFREWQVDPSHRAWDVKKCGMHVHIDSHAFTSLTLGKFIMLINSPDNVDFIRKIAGRHPAKDEQARSYCDVEGSVCTTPMTAIKGKSSNRYYMVNMQNLRESESRRLGFGDRFTEGSYNTVELRIFRASLKKERLLAQIEFTHACVCFCRAASYRDLNGGHFIKWLKTQEGLYPHLSDWYGVRRVRQVPAEQTCVDKTPVAETQDD